MVWFERTRPLDFWTRHRTPLCHVRKHIFVSVIKCKTVSGTSSVLHVVSNWSRTGVHLLRCRFGHRQHQFVTKGKNEKKGYGESHTELTLHFVWSRYNDAWADKTFHQVLCEVRRNWSEHFLLKLSRLHPISWQPPISCRDYLEAGLFLDLAQWPVIKGELKTEKVVVVNRVFLLLKNPTLQFTFLSGVLFTS